MDASSLGFLEQYIRDLVADEVRRHFAGGTDDATSRPGSEVMTADQVAGFLGLDRKTVYDYANRGELPSQKLGKRVLFSRTQIVAWLRGCESALSQKGT